MEALQQMESANLQQVKERIARGFTSFDAELEEAKKKAEKRKEYVGALEQVFKDEYPERAWVLEREIHPDFLM